MFPKFTEVVYEIKQIFKFSGADQSKGIIQNFVNLLLQGNWLVDMSMTGEITLLYYLIFYPLDFRVQRSLTVTNLWYNQTITDSG